MMAGQRRPVERVLKLERKMIWSAGRRRRWRLPDAHNKDNRVWQREKWVMSEGVFGGEPTDVDEVAAAATWTAPRFGDDSGALVGDLEKA